MSCHPGVAVEELTTGVSVIHRNVWKQLGYHVQSSGVWAAIRGGHRGAHSAGALCDHQRAPWQQRAPLPARTGLPPPWQCIISHGGSAAPMPHCCWWDWESLIHSCGLPRYCPGCPCPRPSRHWHHGPLLPAVRQQAWALRADRLRRCVLSLRDICIYLATCALKALQMSWILNRLPHTKLTCAGMCEMRSVSRLDVGRRRWARACTGSCIGRCRSGRSGAPWRPSCGCGAPTWRPGGRPMTPQQTWSSPSLQRPAVLHSSSNNISSRCCAHAHNFVLHGWSERLWEA